MYYKFYAYGHPNILATHKTTLEFAKDDELGLKGNCIVGIKANFELAKIKNFIKKLKTNKITITIFTTKIKETINAEFNPKFNSDKELVIRKTDFISERTFATKADKSSSDISKEIVKEMKNPNIKIRVIISV